MIASNVIHASYKYGVNKLLNLGSSCIYPKNCPQPMKEEYLLTGPLEPTNEPYAIAKIAAIKLCRYYNEQYGTNFISVMPTNLYGPNDNFNLETAHVLPAILRKMHLAKLLNEDRWDLIFADIKTFPLGFNRDEIVNKNNKYDIERMLKELGISKDAVILWGSGQVYRELLYVDDLADACLFLMNKYNAKDIGEIINIGCGNDLLIIEAAKIIRDIVGFKGDIIFNHEMPEGARRKLLDITKIRSLGWQHAIGLVEGLIETYSWYIEKL